MRKIGLIAGNGDFPLEFAKAAKQKGLTVVTVAHEGETAPEISQWSDALFWIRVGQLGKLIKIFKDQGVRDVLMAGGIKKTRLFDGGLPDLRGAALLARMIAKKDDSILRAVAEDLESEGITVRESTLYLDNLLAPAGILTKRKPSKDEWKDISFGWHMAKEIGRLDIGQTVV
ncbi:MAG: UDP-2,3-diacylglucosamine diphosphatase LpxI, partial [Nitrospiraceae bacterium]|nr:UDP-2,3-diacylglucosamine diphosphatase LpxI [Nitrospiraceae bacterium]